MSWLGSRAAATYRARRTVRARLAVLYAGAFLASGVLLLAIPAGFVHGSSSSSSTAAVPGPDGSPSPVTVVANSQHSTDVHNLVIGSLLALIPLVVIAAVLGWIVAGRLLRPLRTITETAREISASNLHRRLDLTGPDDEFKELGTTLDDLFARLEGSFEARQLFIANASHELRTPLAAERTVLQVALADPRADSNTLRTACEQVISLGEQQERLIEALLTLASTEQGLEHRERCDLAAIAASAVQSRATDLESHGVHAATHYGRAIVDGDPRLLGSLVSNLVDNAVRHNRDSGHLGVTTTTSETGQARLFVSNDGPLIAPDQMDRLFQPFQRLGADRVNRTDGHGVGLAVVRAIVDAHGARIDAVARPQGGLAITIDFSPPQDA